MHEWSLVRSLVRQVNALAVEQSAARIVEVRVAAGPLAGIEPLLLREAFYQLRSDAAASAEIRIDAIGLTCVCRRCQLEFASDSLQFVCLHCGSNDVIVTCGDEVTLVSITVETDQEALLA